MIARGPTLLIVNLLRRYIPAAIVAVAVTVAAALIVTLASSKLYRAEMTLAIGTNEDVISAELGSQAQAVVNTVSTYMRSYVVASEVVKQQKLGVDAEEFLTKLDVSQKPDSAALAITYDAPTRRQATGALTALVTAYEQHIAEVGSDASKPVRDPDTGELRDVNVAVRVFDPPYASATPIAPRPVRNLAVAVILGLMLAGFWVALRDALEVRRSEQGGEEPSERAARRRRSRG